MAAGKQCICLESEIPVYITPFEHHRLVLCNAVRCLNQRPCISWRSECPGLRVVLRGFNSLTILTGFFIVTKFVLTYMDEWLLQIVIEHLCNLCYHKWRSCDCSVGNPCYKTPTNQLLVNYQRSTIRDRYSPRVTRDVTHALLPTYIIPYQWNRSIPVKYTIGSSLVHVPRRAVQGLHKVNENEKWWAGFWMVTLDRT